MDPFSITAGVLQVVSACGTCTVSIFRGIEEVRTIDPRIQSFIDEIEVLRNTYHTLNQCLSIPQMIEAARVAQSQANGSDLWSLIRVALKDSTKILHRVNAILFKLKMDSNFARKFRTQLQEALKSGELARLRLRIKFVNATIPFPIHMACVLLRQGQNNLSIEERSSSQTELETTETALRGLADQLNTPSQVSTMDGATWIMGVTENEAILDQKHSYLSFARQLVASALAAANNLTDVRNVASPTNPANYTELPGLPQQPIRRKQLMSEWIQSSSSELPTYQYAEGGQVTSPLADSPAVKDKSYDVDLMLVQRHLELAQDDTDKKSYESAEKRYRKALELFQKHDFSNIIPLTAADVVIMLSKCCLKQEKYDETISLLNPVAECKADVFPKSSQSGKLTQPEIQPPISISQDGKLQALAASHLLGEVYFLKNDYEAAKNNSLTAFLDRKAALGDHKPEVMDSLRLLIKVLIAMDEKEEAEAYEGFLPFEEQTVRRPPRPSNVVLAVRTQSIPTISSPPQTITRESRPSFSSRLMKSFTKISEQVQTSTSSNVTRYTSAPAGSTQRRSTGVDMMLDSAFLHDDKWGVTSPSESSSHNRAASYYDDDSTPPSTLGIERPPMSIAPDPLFQAIAQNCIDKKYDKAVKLAMSLLESYKSKNFIVRRDELEKNIRKGKGVGLAATGKGYAAIHFFIELKEEKLEEVDLLIKAKTDVNAIAYKAGYIASKPQAILFPLNLAIDNGHTNIAKRLLMCRNIELNVKNSEMLVPLLNACRKKNYDLVRTLLSLGPHVIPAEYPGAWYGNSAIHDAARHCDIKLVEVLLEKKNYWNINLQDRFGKTPLMHAVIKTDVSNTEGKAKMVKDRVAVVNTLLAAGADPMLIDYKNLTARSYAEVEEDQALLDALAVNRWELA